jgi:oligosaccharide repeat unit polymerase
MLINPALVYAYIWLLATFLYTRYWSDIFLPLSDITLFYIFGSIFAVGLAWVLTIVMFIGKKIPIKKNIKLMEFSPNTNKKILFLVYIWCIFSAVELLYFRDLPILTVFGMGSITYHTYGIPSLHGFLNAIIQSLSMYAIYLWMKSKDKKYLFFYMLTIVPYILMMTRGGVTSLLIQSIFVFLIFKDKKVSFSLIVKASVLVFVFVFVFSFLGDVRNVDFYGDIYDVMQISSDFPSFLAKDFMWVYMYITAAINNVENTISVYDNWNFEPYIILYGLFPSFIRNILPIPYSPELVSLAFNVSSFMPKYLFAFGIYGSLIFYFLASLVPLYFYQKFIRTREIKYGFILAIFLHSIVLSIFSDFFLIQVYIFQLFLQYLVFNKIIFRVKDVN